jgi:hypothetical protein
VTGRRRNPKREKRGIDQRDETKSGSADEPTGVDQRDLSVRRADGDAAWLLREQMGTSERTDEPGERAFELDDRGRRVHSRRPSERRVGAKCTWRANSKLDPTSILAGALRYAAFVPFGRGSGGGYLIGWVGLKGLRLNFRPLARPRAQSRYGLRIDAARLRGNASELVRAARCRSVGDRDTAWTSPVGGLMA